MFCFKKLHLTVNFYIFVKTNGLVSFMNMERKNYLLAGDAGFFRVLSYFDKKNSPIFNVINEKRNRLDKSKFSYRIINHWQNEGLINDNRPSGKGWRMYSLIDIVWLNIITELRGFGYPIEKIKQVKQSLIEPLEDYKDKHEIPILEESVALALIKKTPTFLLVFENGEALTATFEEMNISRELRAIGNHIQININDILQRLYPNKDLKPVYKSTVNLNSGEMELMFMVRTGNYTEISVKKKNGKIELIEATEQIKADEKIFKILKEQSYQDIELKQQGGKVVFIKRKIKKKISNK